MCLRLLVVDTSTAYFIGDNENDNKEALEHAKWLRSLSTRLPGNPTILVCCHPIKYAKEGEEMIPRGGSAFLNEIDGNLGCSKLGDMTILKQVGKYRDVYFPDLSFKREVVYPKRLNGISTIISHFADEVECEKETKRLEQNQLAVLKLLNESEKKLSVRTMADKLMLPKSNLDRIIQQLKKEKLIDESGMPTAGGLAFLKE